MTMRHGPTLKPAIDRDLFEARVCCARIFVHSPAIRPAIKDFRNGVVCHGLI
ncbi:hypothetical protein RISW2_23835 [Roseivivax isoporae LMG 25204]|uniref:Uncharacterized protein n=1 Tax=Roseivivax isoporae LMG 25204 TaxID=1449351 RepID=X7F0V5_9RHOB|nr:hypothetical protein RISW2_23835 [Roseivivax isoporae LMG 25204]